MILLYFPRNISKKNVFSFWKRLYCHWPLEICGIWRLNTSTYLLLDEGLIEKSTKHILAIIRYFPDCYTSQILKRNSLLYCILLKHIYSVNINTTICNLWYCLLSGFRFILSFYQFVKSLGIVKVDSESLEIRSRDSESVSVLCQVVEQLVAAVKSQSHMALIHCNCYNGKKSLENRKKRWMNEWRSSQLLSRMWQGLLWENEVVSICTVW